MSISKAEAMERIRNKVRSSRPIQIPAHANSVAIDLPPRVTVLARRRAHEKANRNRAGKLGDIARAMARIDQS